MNKLDEIRQILRDKEDFSYTVIDKLIDIIEEQGREIAEIKRNIQFNNENLNSKIRNLKDRMKILGHGEW